MGRIKVFFCAFCLNRSPDQPSNDHSFSQGIDVSHLATPHISSNLSLTARSSSNSTPICENSDDNYQHYAQQGQPPTTVNCSIQHLVPPDPPDRRDSSDQEAPPFHQQDNNRCQPSPPSSTSSPLNQHEPVQPSQVLHQQSHQNHIGQVPQHPQQAVVREPPGPNVNEPATKYDIISVREPLAKILAERQQLQLAQQQQRQILGDHDYIEVYGERGSSCFYEEIAGSTTSSATYDQIGVPSNHNYQVLVNAYALANRPNGSHIDESNHRLNNNSSNNINGHNHGDENMYDITHSSDQVDNLPNISDAKPSTSFSSPTSQQIKHDQSTLQQAISSDRNNALTQSIPVYSVINKATRRSNAVIRATVDNCRPPQPPPKNLLMTHQPSTSAIQTYQKPSMLINSQNSSETRSSLQIPTTSSYLSSSNNNISEFNENIDHHTRIPQPPPRFSKYPMFNATKRPLPLPDSFVHSNKNNSSELDCSVAGNEDVESVNNGYELLTSNFDDDQIDVGYEKIRESNRYSGGSLSSQFCPFQVLDNGGYESVQPIYSSPSNALVEPNYEAIGPATASELAAAATAKLTAAAAVFEQFLKQDQ